MPQAPPNAEPEQVLVAWCDSLARAVIDNPTSWHLMLMPADETPLVMRKRVDAGRAVALEQIRSLVSPILDRRPDLAAIDHELAARMCLAAAAEGARLMLDASAEFPPDRLTSLVVAIFTALGSEPTPHR
jgi:hypothetical protein